jgi:hypothetical protein
MVLWPYYGTLFVISSTDQRPLLNRSNTLGKGISEEKHIKPATTSKASQAEAEMSSYPSSGEWRLTRCIVDDSRRRSTGRTSPVEHVACAVRACRACLHDLFSLSGPLVQPRPNQKVDGSPKLLRGLARSPTDKPDKMKIRVFATILPRGSVREARGLAPTLEGLTLEKLRGVQ